MHQAKLALPNLEILCFNWHNVGCQIRIDCPKLKTLFYPEYSELNLLEIKHPHSISSLAWPAYGPALAQFKNVEKL